MNLSDKYNIKEYLWMLSVVLVSFGCFISNNMAAILGIVLMIIWRFTFNERLDIKEAWHQNLIKGTCLCIVLFIGFYAFSNFLNGSWRGLQEAARYIERVMVGITFLFLSYKRKNVIWPVLIGALIGIAIIDGQVMCRYIKSFKGIPLLDVSFLDNRNNFGAWCILVLPCLCLWVQKFSRKLKVLGFVLALITIALLIMTGSRGALVGGIVMLTVFIYCNRHSKKVLLGSLAFAIVVGAIVYYYYGNGKLSMIHGAGVYGDRERMLLLCTGWQMFLEHPLIGSGFEGWDQFYSNYYIYALGNMKLYTPHNLILDYLDRVGVVGSLGLWFLWWQQLINLYSIYKKNVACKNACMVMLLIMVGMFVHGMVDVTAMNRYFMVLYTFIWVVTVHEIMREDCVDDKV